MSPSTRAQAVHQLLAGAGLPPSDTEPSWIRALRAQLAHHAALEAQLARSRAALEHLTTTLMRLAALDFDPIPTFEPTGDDLIDAANLGLSMMAEELAASQQALKNARDEAIAADKVKSSFLASMSHELRTPLNVIIGYCELAGEDLVDAGPAAVRSDLERISGAATHLLGLISDILDLSKIEAGRMEVSTQEVEVAPLVREVGDAVRHLAESNGNVLVFDLAAAPRVLADPIRLRQVLFNLIGNAAKYTHNGTIEVRSHRDSDVDAVIEVRDTGVGIPPEHLGRLFEPFHRVDERTTTLGTGLGLAITDRLCRMMQGAVEAESTVGVGSTFRVRLPTPPREGPCPSP